MVEDGDICPATACPYMNLHDGSVWTGDQQTPCEGDECAWFHDGACIAVNDLAFELGERAHEADQLRECPDCEYENNCQWQSQLNGVCPPRLAWMLEDPLAIGGAV